MANFLCEMYLQGIMVVVFNILDWIFNYHASLRARFIMRMPIFESRNEFRQNAALHEEVIFLLPTKRV